MDAHAAIDLARHALITTLIVSAPILIAGMAVGLIVGLLQAVTQIQEQSVAFVPKLVAMLVVLSISMPWLVTQMVDYFHDLVVNIPGSL